jgi:hypothetical protein
MVPLGTRGLCRPSNSESAAGLHEPRIGDSWRQAGSAAYLRSSHRPGAAPPPRKRENDHPGSRVLHHGLRGRRVAARTDHPGQPWILQSRGRVHFSASQRPCTLYFSPNTWTCPLGNAQLLPSYHEQAVMRCRNLPDAGGSLRDLTSSVHRGVATRRPPVYARC